MTVDWDGFTLDLKIDGEGTLYMPLVLRCNFLFGTVLYAGCTEWHHSVASSHHNVVEVFWYCRTGFCKGI
jgi:hypothetical protein